MSIARSDLFEHVLHEAAVKKELQAHFDKKGMESLSIREMATLCALASDNLRVNDIADLMGVGQQASGKFLRHLAVRGLVEGWQGQVDGREHIYHITTAGRDVLRGMRE